MKFDILTPYQLAGFVVTQISLMSSNDNAQSYIGRVHIFTENTPEGNTQANIKKLEQVADILNKAYLELSQNHEASLCATAQDGSISIKLSSPDRIDLPRQALLRSIDSLKERVEIDAARKHLFSSISSSRNSILNISYSESASKSITNSTEKEVITTGAPAAAVGNF